MKANKEEFSMLETIVKKYKKVFYVALLFSVAINLLTLAMPVYSLQVYDRVISSRSVETLLMLSIIVAISFAFLSGMTIVRNMVFNNVGNALDKDFSKQLLNNALSVICRNSQVKPAQLLREFNVLKGFVSGSVIHQLFDAPWAVIFIIAVFFIHPVNGVVVVIAASVLFFMAYLNDLSTKKMAGKANELTVDSYNQVEMSARNAEVIQAMGMKEVIIDHWYGKHQESNTLQDEMNKKSGFYSSVTKGIRLFVQMLMMGIGAWLVINNQMSSGGIIATSILAGKALAPFDAAINTWKSILAVKKSYHKVNEFLKRTVQDDGKIALPEPKGQICFENVSYVAEPGTRPIVQQLNFAVNPGEIIGLIGPSGAGKTTIAKLLVGIYSATSGKVCIDGAKLEQWDNRVLGAQIGYLPQDIELFSGTIKENIARMLQNAEEQNIVKAAQLAEAHQMIVSLPKGYMTEVGANAAKLSSGQAQRIGLARAFYGDPKLIVLDEPNAHLDQFGEHALLKAVEHLKKNKITTFIIAHRPAVLAGMDRIMVLKDGRISMFDERDKVLSALNKMRMAA